MYFKENIIALEPRYIKDIGNITCIHQRDGNILKADKRIGTIMKNMASYELLDMQECRKFIGKNLSIYKNIPYVFDLENIFIAIKTRVPIGKNDGAMSYIKISEIEEFQEGHILLSSGLKLKIMDDKSILSKKINQGKIAGVIIKERKFIMKNP